MVKKTESSTKKNLGIGSPVICIFFVTPVPNYQSLFKNMGKTEGRKVGGVHWLITTTGGTTIKIFPLLPMRLSHQPVKFSLG